MMSPLLVSWCGVAVAIGAVGFSTYWSIRDHRNSRGANLEPYYAALSKSMDDYQALVRPDATELIRRYKASDDVDPVKRDAVARAKSVYEEARRHLVLLGMNDDVADSYQHWVVVVERFHSTSVDPAFFVGDAIERHWADVTQANECVVAAMRKHLGRLTHSDMN